MRGTKKVLIDSSSSILDLPKTNAAYWITTNEPVLHSMHKHTNPALLENGHEVIYNGVTMSLRSRIAEHLLRIKCKGNSGISVDLFCDEYTKHLFLSCDFRALRSVLDVEGTST